MNYLFDANAFLDLIRRKKALIAGQYILDLTIYEIGNAIWKEATLFRTLTMNEAVQFMANLLSVVQKMNIIRIEEDLDQIMELAIETHLTFYDAAYLYFAIKKGLTLVTNDKKLFRVAEGKVNVLHSEDI